MWGCGGVEVISWDQQIPIRTVVLLSSVAAARFFFISVGYFTSALSKIPQLSFIELGLCELWVVSAFLSVNSLL